MDDARLSELLGALDPWPRPGEYVYVALPWPVLDLDVLASVDEPEGHCAVVRREDADARGLAYDYVAAWITLRMPSSLADVGLTAAVSTTLAAADISCNVIAGLHHDHLLVPAADADRALTVLDALAASARERRGSAVAGSLRSSTD